MSKRKLLPLLASGLFSSTIFAANIYVSPTGNDANKGTVDSPVKTVTMASKLSYPGDVINVAPGTYNENVKISKSGNSTDKIRIVSTKKWGAKFIGTGTEATWTNNASYVEINGFDISGSGRLGILNQGSYVLMQGNHVHDMKVSGGCTGSGGAGIVNANYSGSDGDIIGNVVHDIGTPGGCNGVQGIYSSNLRGKILNNIVYRASAFGIHLWHGATNVTIANNTVFANGSSTMGGGIVIGTGDAPGGVILDNTKVVNNIVYNNPAGGITEYCYAGQDCIGANNVIANNLVYANGKAIVLKKGTATNTISADPQFVNYQANGTGDYHLKSTSPAINKGTTAYAPLTDLDGANRTSPPDIGAYEYQSAVTTTTSVSFSVAALSFDTALVGNIGTSKTIVVTNTGTAPLLLNKLVTSGDFVLGAGTCKQGQSYAPASACTILVTFSPTASGMRSGNLLVETNANPAETNIALSGTGAVAASARLSVTSLNFGYVRVGSKSAIKVVTITNSGNAPLVFSNAFTISGKFAFGGTGTCKVNTNYAPGTSCTASVVFTPAVKGLQTGALNIQSNAPALTVNLSGTGY